MARKSFFSHGVCACPALLSMAIDCNKQQTDAFEQAFCKAKLAVINNSSSKFNYSDKFKYSDAKEGWETFQDLVEGRK